MMIETDPYWRLGELYDNGLHLVKYVVEKDFQKNNLIVANFFNNKALYKKGLIAKNVNWILGKKPEFPLKVKAQLRYGHKP